MFLQCCPSNERKIPHYIMFNFSVSVLSILQSFVTRRQKLLHLLEINITSQARATGVSLLRLYFNILSKYKYNSYSINNNLLFKTKGWSSQDEKPTHILVCSTILSQPCKQIRILMVQDGLCRCTCPNVSSHQQKVKVQSKEKSYTPQDSLHASPALPQCDHSSFTTEGHFSRELHYPSS